MNAPAASFGGVEFHPSRARKVAVFDSGLWDDFDVAALGAQRLLEPGRWSRQVDVGLEVDSGGEHFDAECVEPVALVQVPDQRGQGSQALQPDPLGQFQ